MSIEDKINDISGLIEALPDKTAYELEIERIIPLSIDFPEKLNSIEECSKNIVFPDLDFFTKLYYKQLFYYGVVSDIHGMKFHVNYYNEFVNLYDFFDDIGKSSIESIRIKAVNGKAIKLKSGILATTISSLIKEFIANQNQISLEKRNGSLIIPKKTLYNKLFIQGLFPLFKHLKAYNPDRPNTDIYSFLREFIIILGFDFYRIYPNSVGDDEPFKSYFSNLK